MTIICHQIMLSGDPAQVTLNLHNQFELWHKAGNARLSHFEDLIVLSLSEIHQELQLFLIFVT